MSKHDKKLQKFHIGRSVLARGIQIRAWISMWKQKDV